MDRRQFGAVVERHRRELEVHCYRMLGSIEDVVEAPEGVTHIRFRAIR
jgi:DNA-directed RNA polymerase specialized sigma24 family protein